MNVHYITKAYDVTKQQAEDFVSCVRVALSQRLHLKMYSPYLFKDCHKAVIISFDSDYQPFIGFTHGYNPLNQRLSVPLCDVLKFTQDALYNYNLNRQNKIAGGRTFISTKVVFREDNIENKEQIIGLFNWKGIDPYYGCR